jgi:hypothetical protein
MLARSCAPGIEPNLLHSVRSCSGARIMLAFTVAATKAEPVAAFSVADVAFDVIVWVKTAASIFTAVMPGDAITAALPAVFILKLAAIAAFAEFKIVHFFHYVSSGPSAIAARC